MACRSVSSSVPVVLRVKRKREEEPANALVLAKIPKLDPSLNKADGEIFHLVSTVQHHHHTNQQVLDHISHHRQHSSLVKLTSFSGLSISKQQEERRQARKDLVSNRRFKFVSKLRSLEDTDHEKFPPSSPAEETHQTDLVDSWIGNVRLYDLESEPADSGDTSSESDSQACKQSEATHRGHEASSCVDNNNSRSTISCNSSPLVRESVRGPGDYVYDLYYTQSCSLQDMMTCNWDNICAHSYESEMVHDLLDSDEEQCYDDEDDSNDEGNWRNDYPDESNSDENSSCDGGVLQYRSAEACLGDEDQNGYLDENYWNKS